ncbi:MAG TPA: metallophosphoesterase [Deltaproteobacteria bacterium]|jgi:hypothetical protein|nr:metallophosphoesterase [Deltaproteobacteria bacterium]HQI01790.1 metallophosphoesterase [Deltaproteobacteria bacterium]HQJ09946.1 metallophosphoesterase [Deltaproteobacteria bacterium]
MTKIGVLSDTHLTKPDKAFAAMIERHFEDADLIVHAGDMVTLSVLDPIFSLGVEVAAVCGNMDHADVQRAYPVSRTIRVEDMRIGIIHGWGSVSGIRSRIRASFKDDPDIIIYGHTHQAYSADEAGVFFFNPGSPTDSRFTSDCSVGIIVIDKNTIRGEIIPV